MTMTIGSGLETSSSSTVPALQNTSLRGPFPDPFTFRPDPVFVEDCFSILCRLFSCFFLAYFDLKFLSQSSLEQEKGFALE